MCIFTSINISVSRKKRLLSAANRLGVPVKEILAALMARSRLHYRRVEAAIFQTVKYQPASFLTGEEYVIMHVRFDPVCYEFGVSERLVFKVSVSLIYRVAIDLFLDSLVQKGLNEPVCDNDIGTNYYELDYDIKHQESVSHEFWTIKWSKRVKDLQKKSV